MVESDYLDQEKLKTQCQAAISVFTANNEKLSELRKTYNSSRDVTFTGAGAEGFVGHCDNYVVLVDAIMTANDCDIADNKTLWAMLGTGVLDGSVILRRQRETKQCEEDELNEADEAKRRKHSAPTKDEREYWDSEYHNHMGLAYLYEEEYKYWKGREEEFDRINTDSKGLFQDSVPIRTEATNGLKELSRDFSHKTFEFLYNPSWKDGIEKLCNQVSVVDKCKEKWKDENGVYNLDVLKDILNNRMDELSAPEVTAFEEVLEELHPEAQKKVIGHAVSGKAEIKDLVQGLVKSFGYGGKIGVDGYNIATSDGKSVRKAGLKFMKDFESATATWAGTLLYSGNAIEAARTLIPDLKKDFIKSISEEGDDLVNVSGGEIIKRSFKKDIQSYAFKNVEKAGEAAIENADDIAEGTLRGIKIKAKDAARLDNVKAGVKWAGTLVDVAFNASDNLEEQKLARKSGIEMSNGRVAAETVIETVVDVGVGFVGNAAAGFVIGGAAALLGISAPAIAVTALSAVAVWGINEAFKLGTGKDAGENMADFLCDLAGLK